MRTVVCRQCGREKPWGQKCNACKKRARRRAAHIHYRHAGLPSHGSTPPRYTDEFQREHEARIAAHRERVEREEPRLQRPYHRRTGAA